MFNIKYKIFVTETNLKKLQIKRNNQIRRELKVEEVNGIINMYTGSWKQHVSRMGSDRFPKKPCCISRKEKKAWKDLIRVSPTSLKPEKTKQYKP